MAKTEYIDGLFGTYEKRFKGAFSSKLTKKKAFHARIGMAFSRLTVVEALGSSCRTDVIFGLSCTCGVQIAHNAKSVFFGASVSCGCAHKENASLLHLTPARLQNVAQPGVVARKATYSEYVSRAARRGYVFDLTFDQFVEITQRHCYLCGSPPSNKTVRGNSRGSFTYSGIDRVDNTVGYVLSNCRPCCGICNGLKMSSTLDFTLSHMRKIIAYQDSADLFN